MYSQIVLRKSFYKTQGSIESNPWMAFAVLIFNEGFAVPIFSEGPKPSLKVETAKPSLKIGTTNAIYESKSILPWQNIVLK